MGLALFIIFGLATVAAGVYTFYQEHNLVISPMADANVKKIIQKQLIFSGIIAVCFTLMLVGGMIWGEYPCDGLHWFKLIAGGLLFGFSLPTAVQFFILHYYGKNIDDKSKKTLMYAFIGLYIAAFLTLWLWLDGYAPYLTYPIVNGVDFTKGFVTPTDSRPTVAWYAICIISGAVLVYFMCDHFMFKEYGEHGILESTFYIAFPAGIIGARLWYCIGDGVPFSQWIKIWQGGLTILGGAIMGILVGVLWFIFRKKKYSIWIAIDCIVPTILIAQAVGRFGNFFNCEVHGVEVSMDNFKWLPEIIRNNMTYTSGSHKFAEPGNMFVPLFLIEALINVFGYFFIAHFVGKKLRKVLEPGDLGISYVIWYGFVRAILEPFRDTNFNMGGESGYWSWMWSLIFVFFGALGIVVNHIVRYILKKRKNNYVVLKGDNSLGLIETIVLGTVGIAILVVSVVLMTKNTFGGTIAYSPFNIGVMLCVLGASVLVCAVPAFIRFWEARKVVNA